MAGYALRANPPYGTNAIQMRGAQIKSSKAAALLDHFLISFLVYLTARRAEQVSGSLASFSPDLGFPEPHTKRVLLPFFFPTNAQ
jgi:hypothetical protein